MIVGVHNDQKWLPIYTHPPYMDPPSLSGEGAPTWPSYLCFQNQDILLLRIGAHNKLA